MQIKKRKTWWWSFSILIFIPCYWRASTISYIHDVPGSRAALLTVNVIGLIGYVILFIAFWYQMGSNLIEAKERESRRLGLY